MSDGAVWKTKFSESQETISLQYKMASQESGGMQLLFFTLRFAQIIPRYNLRTRWIAFCTAVINCFFVSFPWVS